MLISILDPEAMYIVKNTGTMVIGVAKSLQSVQEEEVKTLEEGVAATSKPDEHLFQIVASDTTVF